MPRRTWPIPSLLDRIWEKVIKTDTCWLWTASTVKGYGRIGEGGTGRSLLVHKVLWELENGPVPDGLELDHLCRVRRCVRPSHLEAVTHRVNVIRSPLVTERLVLCQRGHVMSGTNLGQRLSRGTSSRYCKACDADGQRARRALTASAV